MSSRLEFVSAHVDDVQYQVALRKFLAVYPGTMEEAMNLRSRMLMVRIGKLLPPKSKSQGNKKVERDYYRSASPLIARNFSHPWVRKAIRTGNASEVQLVVNRAKSGALSGRDVVEFSSEMHKASRDRRGRVDRRYMRLAINGQFWRKRLRIAKSNVGFLKAGAYVIAHKLGHRAPAKWLNKPRAGSITKMAQRGKYTVTCTFNAHYADEYARRLDHAVTSETKSMLKSIDYHTMQVLRKEVYKNNPLLK